jgi:hypothetical protein
MCTVFLQAEHVVVIDCDGKFDSLRLLQVRCYSAGSCNAACTAAAGHGVA